MDDIERQVRANLQPAPDWRLRVTEVNAHHEALELSELGSAQLGASRPCRLSLPSAGAGQGAGELSEIIELGSADDRLELAQNVSLPIVLAHARRLAISSLRVAPCATDRPSRPEQVIVGQEPTMGLPFW